MMGYKCELRIIQLYNSLRVDTVASRVSTCSKIIHVPLLPMLLLLLVVVTVNVAHNSCQRFSVSDRDQGSLSPVVCRRLVTYSCH